MNVEMRNEGYAWNLKLKQEQGCSNFTMFKNHTSRGICRTLCVSEAELEDHVYKDEWNGASLHGVRMV